MSKEDKDKLVGMLLAVLVAFSVPVLFVLALMLGYILLPLIWAAFILIVLVMLAISVAYAVALPYYMTTKGPETKKTGSYSLERIKGV